MKVKIVKLEEDGELKASQDLAKKTAKELGLKNNNEIFVFVEAPTVSDFLKVKKVDYCLSVVRCTDEEWLNFFYSHLSVNRPKKAVVKRAYNNIIKE